MSAALKEIAAIARHEYAVGFRFFSLAQVELLEALALPAEPAQEAAAEPRAVRYGRQLVGAREAGSVPAEMSTQELQSQIGYMQQELIRRVCGDPVCGVGLTIPPTNTQSTASEASGEVAK